MSSWWGVSRGYRKMSARAGAICRFNWDGCLGDSPPGWLWMQAASWVLSRVAESSSFMEPLPMTWAS